MALTLTALLYLSLAAPIPGSLIFMVRHERARKAAKRWIEGLPPLKAVAEYTGDGIPWDVEPDQLRPIAR